MKPSRKIAQRADALRASDGDVAAAARALGISRSTLAWYLWLHPEAWPSEIPRTRPQKNITDEAVTAALRNARSISRAACELGVSRSTLIERIARRPEIWPVDVPRRAAGQHADTHPHYRDPQIDRQVTDALRASGGSIAAAARALGISRQALHDRLARRPELWPEDVNRIRARR